MLQRSARGLFLCFFLLISFAGNAKQTPFIPLSPNDQSSIEWEQQQRLERQQQELDALKHLQPDQQVRPPQPQLNEPCFAINKISIRGATLLSANDKFALLGDIDLKCITLTTINQILANITDWYVSRGYVTSRAYLSEQDLSSGELIIDVMEGRIESINFNGNESKKLNFLLPSKAGDLLNLRDIEQGLDQLNRLSRYQCTIDLQPGASPGSSVVQIKAQQSSLLSITASVDNSGQESTGLEQFRLNSSLDDLLGIADQWLVNVSTSTKLGSSSKSSENIFLGIDIPWGYWNAGYNWNRSHYISTFTPFDYAMKSEGNSQTHKFYISNNLYRDGISKLKLRLSINHRRDENYLQNILLTSSSRNLSNLQTGLNYSRRFGNMFASGNLDLIAGSTLFGAEDDSNKASGIPEAEFKKATLLLSIASSISPDWRYNSSFYYQYTSDLLYGSERVSIGSEYSVRGFKSSSISGDKGGYLRNDLTWSRNGAFIGQWLNSLSLNLGIDAGIVRNNNHDYFSEGHLFGIGTSLSLVSAALHTRIALGAPLYSPDWLNTDDWVINWKLALQF